jgi:hypothetical protein
MKTEGNNNEQYYRNVGGGKLQQIIVYIAVAGWVKISQFSLHVTRKPANM